MNTNTTTHDDSLSHDDMSALQKVLMQVRGSFPDEPYRQTDFAPEDFEPKS